MGVWGLGDPLSGSVMARGEGGRGWSQGTQVQEYTCARKKMGRKPELDKGQSETVWRKERSL